MQSSSHYEAISPNQSTAADTNNPVPAEWLEHIGLNVQLPLLNLLFDFKTSLLNVLGYWAAGYTLGFQLQVGGSACGLGNRRRSLPFKMTWKITLTSKQEFTRFLMEIDAGTFSLLCPVPKIAK